MKYLLYGYTGWYGSMLHWVEQGLNSIGADVTVVDRNNPMPTKGYNVYLIVDCSEDISDRIPEVDGVKVFWSMDAHMPGGNVRSSNIARKCDIVFSSNYEYGAGILRQYGIKSHLLPITYVDAWTPKVPKKIADRKYDVVMLGHPNSQERLRLWELLQYRFKCVLGKVDGLDEYKEVMAEAKIIINQPTEPWDIIVNNRGYEAMGFGALLLQKQLQTKLYEKLGYYNNNQFIYWNDLEMLPHYVQQLLGDIGSYQFIANNGNRKVQHDSMSKQMKKMEGILLSEFYNKL